MGFGDKLETIEYGAFASCTSLKRFKIPTVRDIEIVVFHNCEQLMDVAILKLKELEMLPLNLHI